jgi:hypothetical protein
MCIRAIPILAVAFLSGCGIASFQAPGDTGTVLITVRNRASTPLSTTVCGPAACSPTRMLSAGGVSRFRIEAGGGTRAVVTAKRGDLIVTQKPVDFAPGDEFNVNLNVP